MKTVLFITTEPVHQALYERQLKKHFCVELLPSVAGDAGKVDAVVYDIPKYPSSVDLEWLEALDLPIVVLAPDPVVHVPKHAKQHVLYYYSATFSCPRSAGIYP